MLKWVPEHIYYWWIGAIYLLLLDRKCKAKDLVVELRNGEIHSLGDYREPTVEHWRNIIGLQRCISRISKNG